MFQNDWGSATVDMSIEKQIPSLKKAVTPVVRSDWQTFVYIDTQYEP